MDRIDSFKGRYRFMSNFFKRPFTWQGREWPSVEHAFQSGKAPDEDTLEAIRTASTPARAKQLAWRLPLRADWDRVKEDIMRDIIRQKFAQHADLREKLLATGDAELIEGNHWHDNTWGNCTCSKCAGTAGRNLLGRILMQVRTEMRAGG